MPVSKGVFIWWNGTVEWNGMVEWNRGMTTPIERVLPGDLYPTSFNRRSYGECSPETFQDRNATFDLPALIVQACYHILEVLTGWWYVTYNRQFTLCTCPCTLPHPQTSQHTQTYRIARKFRGLKFSRMSLKKTFRDLIFEDYLSERAPCMHACVPRAYACT